MKAPGTLENGVLIGLDNTLFLAGGAHSVFDIVTGVKNIQEKSICLFEENIAERVKWSAGNNVEYLHIIFPDKQSIVPHLWPLGTPIRLGEVILRGTSYKNRILYPWQFLADKSSVTVSDVDTHLTDHGSILVAGHVVEELTKKKQTLIVDRLINSISAGDDRAGDLGSKLDPPQLGIQMIAKLQQPGRWVTNNILGGNNGLIDIRFNNDPEIDRRIVVFGDSFGRELSRFLQYWFREVIFFRTGFFDPDLARLCQPDFLITENVERYLDDCKLDDERPHFFMYPHFRGQAYEVSTEFATLLSDVLSKPRPPYKKLFLSEFGKVYKEGSENSEWRSTGKLAFLEKEFTPSSLEKGEPDGRVIEKVKIIRRRQPEFIENLSGSSLQFSQTDDQDLHGTILSNRTTVLLVGPNILVTKTHRWSCESRAFGEQFVEMVASDAFRATFPGPKPGISFYPGGFSLNLTKSRDHVEYIDQPVFLATPLEPDNWGRWVHSVIPKIKIWKDHSPERLFFCRYDKAWQQALLVELGVSRDCLLKHDPGRSYICRDVMSVESTVSNMTVSRSERMDFLSMVRDMAPKTSKRFSKLLFVSRISLAKKQQSYRVLQNEEELRVGLESLGFETIEPETLTFAEQVAAFNNASIVVVIGGAALYNAVFCSNSAIVITLESSGYFLHPHCNLLSSADLRHGVIIGQQDFSDPTPVHKRWSLEISIVLKIIQDVINVSK